MIDLRNLPKNRSKGECFAITTYCNTENKLRALNRTIDNLKQYGLDIMIHAHYPLSKEIQDKVNSYYYSSDNPVLSRYSAFWYFTERFKLEIKVYDVNYTQLKAWSEIINILSDYERIHIINYDANITPDVFALSKKYKRTFFLQHPDLSGKYIFATYFCLAKRSFDYFRESMTFEKYVNYPQSDKFLPKMEEFIPSFICDNHDIIPCTEYDMHKMMEYDVAADTRFDWENSLTCGNVKVFIGEFNDSVSILFFDVKKVTYINLSINGLITEFNVNSEHLFNLNMTYNEINSLMIKVDDIPVSEDLIKKLFVLESKIYPI